MRCVLCKTGTTQPGFTTVALTRGETSVVIKNVPAAVCQTCGEYYLDETVTGLVLQRAEEAVAKGAEVEILRFAA
ncbi:MAG: type II toxin-antitoxin system MqsA family antitoxin [Thermodesulfobacteriota bacterium]